MRPGIFCRRAENGIAPGIEVIDIKDVKAACEKVEEGDVRFRDVIDMATLAAGPG